MNHIQDLYKNESELIRLQELLQSLDKAVQWPQSRWHTSQDVRIKNMGIVPSTLKPL